MLVMAVDLQSLFLIISTSSSPQKKSSNVPKKNKLALFLSSRMCYMKTVTQAFICTATVLPTLCFGATYSIPDRFSHFPPDKYTPQDIATMDAPSANPWLSIPPNDTTIDWSYWKMKKVIEAQQHANEQMSRTFSNVHAMNILPTTRSHTFLPRFGSFPNQENTIILQGQFDLPEATDLIAQPEDEGSIPLATQTQLSTGNAVIVDAEIGDGPFGMSGTGSGDFDFYAVTNVSAGQRIIIDIDTAEPFMGLDSFVEVYDSNGNFIDLNDDDPRNPTFDSYLEVIAPYDGDFYISIGAYGSFALNDPFDSSSGPGFLFGEAIEGEYRATISLDYESEANISFFLRSGDAFGAALLDANMKLSLSDSSDTELQGSTQDLRFIMPQNSPLPAGLVSVNHVAEHFGRFTLTLRSSSNTTFTLKLHAALPSLRIGARDQVQTIFIDFDGETVDLAESLNPDAPPGELIRTLSPLSQFIPLWGLHSADEDAVIDSIMRVVESSLVTDIKEHGSNPFFNIRLLNSRDHSDPFGQDNVSRIIVGGTIDELGVNTIGIAQSIDVGNFDTRETAFVLLDLLSLIPDPLDPDIPSVSLNTIARAANASMIDLIGVGVGKVIAHEAGHYLGNWHTDQFNDQAGIMDQGGNFAFTILGLGPDQIFGTSDDANVVFAKDNYVPSEGLTGIEDTLNTIAWGSTRASLLYTIQEDAEGVMLEF